MEDTPVNDLWEFNTGIAFLLFISLILFLIIYGISKLLDFRHIKKNWNEYRCSPTIMPFVSLFGYDAKENLNFCMGKVFNTHSAPYLGSFGHMLTNFTGLLTSMFGSIGSLRNTVASLGGGINVIFQEFTERISSFFFQLRISAIHIKTLIGRMYAILFSVMYMGLSGITGMTTFTNTFLFSFLDTFCFPGDTLIHVKNKGHIPIRQIQIGDILLPTNSTVTGTFRFYAKGQPMVKLNDIIVSTNHYIKYSGKNIKVGEHPHAIKHGLWRYDEPLYCLNTSNNIIPINGYEFLDYDETSEADDETMRYIQGRINGTKPVTIKYKFTEYAPGFHPNTGIKLKSGVLVPAKEIKIGEELVSGSRVVGLIKRRVGEICTTEFGECTPSTLIWRDTKWQRVGELYEITKQEREVLSFIVEPNSQIELENGIRIRDYMELCSPDSEIYYSKHLEK